MPNTFIENREAWLRMSDIDYVGQFVKAWLAFNAWYRSAYSETQDRKIINEFKWQSNSVLNTLRPKLEAQSDEAVQFRTEIGLLHQRLENFELLSGKGTKKRITMRNVFLRENTPSLKTDDRYGILFRVELLASKQVAVNVTRKKGVIGARGGRAHACNLRLRQVPPRPPVAPLPQPLPQTAHQTSLQLDAQFPWLAAAFAPCQGRRT